MTDKNQSVFYPTKIVHRVKKIAKSNDKIKSMINNIIHKADEYVTLDDSKIWDLIFDPYLIRSHYVNSNSQCPVCGKKRLLYGWDFDPKSYPWKVQCPDCKNLFPKNDFYAFYKSGINDKGVFSYDIADKSLLYNTEHPDPDDPKHLFAVDDGRGYVKDNVNQRFIGAYLVHGQFKKLILPAIESLSYAYLYTGEKHYAHKCAVLLDRLADHWPDYDARTQSYMYDNLNRTNGYIGYWHSSYGDISIMACAYDIIRGEILNDKNLLQFIKSQSKKYSIPFKKDTASDICNHIENRILKDALNNYLKCRSNFPMTPALYAVIHAVLGNNKKVNELLEKIIIKSTECDGASKENGLTGYTNGAKSHLTEILLKFVNIKPGFIDEMLKKYPTLIEAYRFYIDTLCIDKYYPKVGDCGAFAQPTYKCIHKGANQLYMLYKCYKITQDPVFIQAINSSSNGNYAEQLSELLFLTEDKRDKIIKEIDHVLNQQGTEMVSKSSLKPKWHLGILRSGKQDNKRALWIDFDWLKSGHQHIDPMNIGLFYRGMDIMPDWGYPTVVYDGGFSSDQCKWGKSVFVHNCVTMDRSPGKMGAGNVKLWSIGENMKTISCQNPAMLKKGKQYGRTLSLIDISLKDSYIIDVFRLCGKGKLYERYIHGAMGSVKTSGMKTDITKNDYNKKLFVENLKGDKSPDFGWHVDFDVEDYFDYVKDKKDWHLKCTDLTYNSQAYIADLRYFGNRNYEYKLDRELLVPCAITRKQTKRKNQPVVFAQVIEPYVGNTNIKRISRIKTAKNVVAVKVNTENNLTDIIIYNDPYKKQEITLEKYNIKTDALVSMIRKNGQNNITYMNFNKGSYLNVDNINISANSGDDFLEVEGNEGKFTFISGKGTIKV